MSDLNLGWILEGNQGIHSVQLFSPNNSNNKNIELNIFISQKHYQCRVRLN
jgi:hypothetical protein